MDTSSQSVFCDAALISGLLTQQQVEEVLSAATMSGPGPALSPGEFDDPLIASQAVRLGFLNRWQAEQLKAGRTKFTLGPYYIVDSIGQGGMGHVFKAEHSMLGRIEAVKVLPKSKTTRDSIASFQREIRAQAQLDHPNLVRVSYAGQDGSTYFFVTEYVPGTDLRRLVRRNGRLTLAEATTIVSQAARGLEHAHQRGLVHRDIKPGNLLVTPDGHTKVTDLGLAGYLAGSESETTDPHAGKIVGTADYLAPETIRSPGDFRPVSDIYALGCTLYYAVTGKVPFPGGTTADKLRRHCDEMPLNPQRLNPELDHEFLEVLGGMMDKDSSRRIQTAAEVIRRLAPWALEAVPTLAEKEVVVPQLPRRPAPPPLRATSVTGEPGRHFLEEDMPGPDHDSLSQSSQGTEPVASAGQETLPIDEEDLSQRTSEGISLSGILSALLVPILLLVALVITAMVLITVFKW